MTVVHALTAADGLTVVRTPADGSEPVRVPVVAWGVVQYEDGEVRVEALVPDWTVDSIGGVAVPLGVYEDRHWRDQVELVHDRTGVVR